VGSLQLSGDGIDLRHGGQRRQCHVQKHGHGQHQRGVLVEYAGISLHVQIPVVAAAGTLPDEKIFCRADAILPRGERRGRRVRAQFAGQNGEAKNSWLTGTAAWTYFTVTQWIFGIRTDYDGLRIDPVIPAKWKGFTVTRRFRGNTYIIEVKNPDGKQRGVKKLLVDGKKIAGNILTVQPQQSKPIQVEAILED
jgi:hypothetical protein